MDLTNVVESLAFGFSISRLIEFFQQASLDFVSLDEDYIYLLDNRYEGYLESLQTIGEIPFSDIDSLLIVASKLKGELTSRSSKKKQYEIAKKVLKSADRYDAGIFVFYDSYGNFRFSLITIQYLGTKRRFSTYKRQTFFVSPELPNKTFITQIGKADFSSLDCIKQTFSLEAVTDEFYNEFTKQFFPLAESVKGTNDCNLKQDFALLFAIRIIFLGFVQKRGWLGEKPDFLQYLFKAYKKQCATQDTFYSHWLEPLFFDALSSPPGKKIDIDDKFPSDIAEMLQMSPFLNGDLFKRKPGYDDCELFIPDAKIKEFLDFLFSYNFTIEENTLYDEELELNPEFLGIIFERLVQKDAGAVYTPRTEVDFMSRIALTKWLEKNTSCSLDDLYHFIFKERGTDEEQKQGDFSAKQIKELINALTNITVCDPAAGSGAFLVGMLQLIEELLQNLYSRNNAPPEYRKTIDYEHRKQLIAQCLYGAEVKPWAVWICQLRLWLSLFIDMPDDLKNSQNPLLPSLTFKIRCGDSLIQRLGDRQIPISTIGMFATHIKNKIKALQKLKTDFYYNRISAEEVRKQEYELLKALLAKSTSIDTDKGNSLYEKKATSILSVTDEFNNLAKDPPFIWNIEFAEIFQNKGGFDIIIGNPPYVQQESIGDPAEKLSPSEYKNALIKMVIQETPASFQKAIRDKKIRIDKKSDLYTYFYIKSLHLLNEKGIHVFICSNSWLDVGYGSWLQFYLLNNAPIHFVFDNHAKRSFASADVNTIITVIDPPAEEVKSDRMVKFVAFKKSFEQVIISENLLGIEESNSILRTDDFRVFPIRIEELIKEGIDPDSNKYIGDKWGGKYLRAPDIFFAILNKGKDKLIKLEKVAHIEGYIHDNNTGAKYPRVPFIKSVKHLQAISLTRNKQGVSLYGVKKEGKSRIVGDILYPRTIGDRHVIPIVLDKIYGKEFYKIILPNKERKKLLGLFLNSTLGILEREIFGNTNLGGGALKFDRYSISKMYVIDNLPFKGSFIRYLLERKQNSVFTELGFEPNKPIETQEPKPLSDRAKLDTIIFDALGLTEEERKDVYRAVCRLVYNRISKAKSVKKRR